MCICVCRDGEDMGREREGFSGGGKGKGKGNMMDYSTEGPDSDGFFGEGVVFGMSNLW